MTTPILLDSPYWALVLFYLILEPVGIAGVAASVLTGLLCGRYMTNLSVRVGLVIGALTVVVVPYAGYGWLYLHDWGVEWAFVVICVAFTLGTSLLWNLCANAIRNSG